MQTILCLLNGLTDAPLEDLDGKTPLEKAKTPHMDRLAKEGEVAAVSPPLYGGHETALLAALGCRTPLEAIPCGPLEAYAIGAPPAEGELAFSLYFVSIGQDTVIDISESTLSDSEGRMLCRELTTAFGPSGTRFLPLYGTRAVAVGNHPALREALACGVSLLPGDLLGKSWSAALRRYGTLRHVQAWIAEVGRVLASSEVNALREDLEEPLVNGVLLCHGGVTPDFTAAKMALAGRRAALYSCDFASRGLARGCGIEEISLPAEERKYDHIKLLRKQIPLLMKDHDLVVIESHHLWHSTLSGRLLEKIKAIEYLDRELIGPIATFAREVGCRLMLRPLRRCDIRIGALVAGTVPLIAYPAAH